MFDFPIVPAISIHALLAESDCDFSQKRHPPHNFYPRSPCGERHLSFQAAQNRQRISIHALLAESDSAFDVLAVSALLISIHALLAESD